MSDPIHGHDGPDGHDGQGDDDVEVRRVQPYEAVKTYLCPGCNQDIEPGTGHVVVIPSGEADLRRHWHRPCWEHRARRRPGRLR